MSSIFIAKSHSAKLLPAALLLLSSEPGAADFWFDQHLGLSNGGLTWYSQLNYAEQSKIYSIRALGTTRCLLGCGGSTNDEYNDHFEFSINYGNRYKTEWTTTTLQAGIGVFSATSKFCTTNTDCDPASIGVPLNANFTFGKYAGLGVSLFVNLNAIEALIGASVGYSFGKF